MTPSHSGGGETVERLDAAFRDLEDKATPAPRSPWRRAVPLLAVLALVAVVGLTVSALRSFQQSRVVLLQHFPYPTAPTRLTVSGTTFGIAMTSPGSSQPPGASGDVAGVLVEQAEGWLPVVSRWGPLGGAQPLVLDSQRASGSSVTFTLAVFPAGTTEITPRYAAPGQHDVGTVPVSASSGSGYVFTAVSSDDDDHQPRGFDWVDSQGQHHATP